MNKKYKCIKECDFFTIGKVYELFPAFEYEDGYDYDEHFIDDVEDVNDCIQWECFEEVTENNYEIY